MNMTRNRTVLERVLYQLLAPLPSRIFIEVRDRRGGKFAAKLVRTPPTQAYPSDIKPDS
jgi:hypothetical protein